MSLTTSETRPYRGRGQYRPCDRCRARKIRCAIQNVAPCEACLRSKQPCTFAKRPPPRARTEGPNGAIQWDSGPAATADSWQMSSNSEVNLENFGLNVESEPLSLVGWDTPTFDAFLNNAGENLAVDELDSRSAPLESPTFDESQTSKDFTHHSTTVIGGSSEFDPFLRSFYKFDGDSRFSSQLRSFEAQNQGEGPLLMLTPSQTTWRSSKDLFPQRSHTVLADLKPYHDRLLALFRRFVGSKYPVVASSDDIESSPALLAMIYAFALPWRSNDASLPWSRFTNKATQTALIQPPNIGSLLRFAWDCICEESHGPTKATLQACLLFMEREQPDAFVCKTAFDSVVSNMALTLALSLGVNRNTGAWNISTQDQRSYRILWWITYLQHVWTASINGQQCLVSNVKVDVEELQAKECGNDETSTSWARMVRFCSLTRILESMLALINGSPTSADMPASNQLGLSLDEWNAINDTRTTHATDDAELRMAYTYCRILLLRSMLQNTLHTAEFTSVYDRSLSFISHELLPNINAISLVEIESFWFSWSKSYFSTAADFFILLQVLAPDETSRSNAAAAGDKYRQWLWVYSKSHELTRMGLARYDTLLKSFENGQLRKTWT